GGADKTVKLWDLATGKPARVFGPVPDPVSAVAFSRDFARVGAAAGKDVKVWNVADGKELITLKHPPNVTGLWVTVDNTKMQTSGVDNTARVWDAATGLDLQSFPHTGAVTSVVFHANNANVVTGSADKTVGIHTLAIARAVPVPFGTPARALTLTPNASHILVASDDKTVKLVNLASGAIERSFVGAEGPVRAVTVAKNNVLVAIGGADGQVRLYNFADGKELLKIKAPGVVRGLAFTPNNTSLAAVCENGSIATWNVVYTPGQPAP